MIAQALGNPFNLAVVTELAVRYNLWLVEDDCDSLGATYNGQKTGTFGDLATVSFYPAHHITMGEGGAVLVNYLKLLRPAWSFLGLGSRLLLRNRKRQYLSQTIQLAIRRVALRL